MIEASAAHVTDGVGRLPVYRDGAIVAWATVDAEDVDRLARFTWRRHCRGYVFRNAPERGSTPFLTREVLGLTGGGPRVLHRDGDQMNCRKTNLRVSPSWLARKIDESPELRGLLFQLARASAA